MLLKVEIRNSLPVKALLSLLASRAKQSGAAGEASAG